MLLAKPPAKPDRGVSIDESISRCNRTKLEVVGPAAHNCSDCYRLERKLPGGICTRWKTVPLHGAHDKGRYRQHRAQSRGPTLLKLHRPFSGTLLRFADYTAKWIPRTDSPFDLDDPIVGGGSKQVTVKAATPGCFKYDAGAFYSGASYGMSGGSKPELIILP